MELNLPRRRWEIWEIDSVLEQNEHELRSHFDTAQAAKPYINEVLKAPERFESTALWLNRAYSDVIDIGNGGLSIEGRPSSSTYYSVALKCAMPVLLSDDFIGLYAWAWGRSKADRLKAGRLICDVPFAAICTAAGNNFRHYSGPKWRGGRIGDRSDAETFTKLGIAQPWDRILAPDIWSVLAYDEFGELMSDLRTSLIALRPIERQIPRDSLAYARGFR